MDLKAFALQLKSPDVADDVIIKCLNDINRNISLMDPREGVNVELFLEITFLNRSELVCSCFCDFVLNLVTAYTLHVRPVINMILRNFLPKPNKTELNHSEIKHETSEQLHKLLCRIFTLIPSSIALFISLSNKYFPYLRKESSIQELYVKNLLQVTLYLPAYRKLILELIISKIIEIDVHCSKNEIEDAEEIDDDTIFPMETDVVSSKEEKSDDMKLPLAKTLDRLLEIIYNYIDDVCRLQGTDDLDWEATKKLYKELLAIFDSKILPTHACAHVQYIMFYICSLRQLLCEGFIDYLWKKLLNPNVSPVIRQASTCYIGSLLCRAKYIRIEMVKDILQLMCNWLRAYIEIQSEVLRDYTNFGHHGTFYAVCQTIFYIFGFRHKDLIEMKNGLSFLVSLNFDRLVTSNLNPLKVCLPAVVTNFASVARNYQIAYCYTVIERNNRTNIPIASEAASLSSGLNGLVTLETFFPFDPYLLKRSGDKILRNYRVYQGTPEIDENSASEDEEDEFLQEMLSGTTGTMVPEVFGYGSSPGFKEQICSKYK